MAARKKSVQKIQEVIRDPDFSVRLNSACDQNSACPPLHKGRLVWLKKLLEERFDEKVSLETVRKWFSGVAKPRPDKGQLIAKLLKIDVAWLMLGVDPDLEPLEKKERNSIADGVVNVVAGLIQLDGGHIAFPEQRDSKNGESTPDIYAIISGKRYAFTISIGEYYDSELRFIVPKISDDVLILGVLRDGFSFRVYLIPEEILKVSKFRGGSVEIVVKEIRDLKPIRSFSARL